MAKRNLTSSKTATHCVRPDVQKTHPRFNGVMLLSKLSVQLRIGNNNENRWNYWRYRA